ncbi:MAG: PKD domain-containing protein [Planctomycetes bacterium]|nr:PKD domain-containing protein [Planctomycetota bacterium]
MLRLLVAILCAAPAVCTQSPLETTFPPLPGQNQFVVTNTPSPITGLFDLNVAAPIVLNSIDLQVNTSHGVNGQLRLWLTAPGGSHVGNEQNPGAWTQVSTAATVHAGGRVTFLLQPPVALPPASYGVAFHMIQANPTYWGGTTSGTLPQTYANNELTIDLGAGRMRVSDPIDPFAAGGAGYSPRQMSMALDYTLGATSVDFSSSVTGGATPLTVQFTELATSGAPGGVLAYIWDFDGDNVPDSTAPNPTHTYTQCGSYTVSLSIVDATGTYTETKVDHIVTDIVTPSFDNALIGPGQLQFTDTSSPPPTSWDWDLDGDGVSDSNLQHPTFTYPSTCDEVTVTLTVTRLCQPPVTLTRTIAVATTLETTFAGGVITAQNATEAADFFDVSVANPTGVTVCGVHVHSVQSSGGPLTIRVWQTEHGYAGKTGDVSQWRLVANETVVSAGANQRTFVPFSKPVHLAPGDFGICMEHVGASPVYSNLGGPLTVSNADLSITAGLIQAAPTFTATTATYAPRIGNFALHYQTSAATGTAGYGFLGAGCAGALGVPGNISTTQPVLGGQATIVVDRLAFDVGVMALGTARNTPAIDLAFVGMPGCALHHSADVLLTLVGAANSATFAFPVPNNAALVGTQVYTQAASFDPGANTLGLALSDAAVMLVGL